MNIEFVIDIPPAINSEAQLVLFTNSWLSRQQNEHPPTAVETEVTLGQYSGLAWEASVLYHADGELCRLYTPQEFLPIVQSATAHIMYHTTYFNCLKMQVRNMTNISEICNINYGDTLLPEYATVLSQIVSG